MAIPPALQRSFAAFQAGDIPRAASEAQAALREAPDHPDVHYLLGVIHLRRSAPDLAEPYLRRACEASPANTERRTHLARALLYLNRLAEAAELARSLVQELPASPVAHRLLGEVLSRMRDDDGALASLRRAMELAPAGIDTAVAMRIGGLLNARADHAGARAVIDRALSADQNDPQLAGSAAFTATAWSDLTPQQLFLRHTEIRRRITRAPALPLSPLINTREPDRKLRIAYMTPDARQHSVSNFLEAIFANHDRSAFDIGLYGNVGRNADATTERFASHCDRFVVLTGMNERQAAERLIEDRNDILIDLAGHTAGTGVWLLRSRIAPVQMTYLGYPNTTGMPCADVRIVDAVTDPPGSESLATERLERIDPCFLCYTSPAAPPPAIRDASPRAGSFTFGSFNALHKHSPATIELFSAVLKAVPDSRLLVKSRALGSSEVARMFADGFARRGIEPARLELLAFAPSADAHLSMYQRVDVALDTTPYNGTTTSCEALLMGVPLIALRGDRHAARVSASLLSAIGGPHAELIADSTEAFVRLAGTLADHGSPLTRSLQDRAANRQRFLESPVCDGPGFTRRLEGVYRYAWRRWCSQGAAGAQG